MNANKKTDLKTMDFNIECKKFINSLLFFMGQQRLID